MKESNFIYWVWLLIQHMIWVLGLWMTLFNMPPANEHKPNIRHYLLFSLFCHICQKKFQDNKIWFGCTCICNIFQLRFTHWHFLENWFSMFNSWFDLLCLTPLSAIFQLIMATSFSGGRSRSTRREPPTMGKQLVNFITCSCELSASFFVIYKAGCDV